MWRFALLCAAVLVPCTAISSPTESCASGILDMVFIIDGSTSIYPGNFSRALNLIIGLTERLPVNDNGVRVGLIQFNGRQRTEFSLGTHTTKEEVLSRLNRTRYQMGVTHAGAAVDYALEKEFVAEKGDRSDARDVLIVLSDGLIQDNIEGPAQRAAERGVDVFAVGVTPLWWDFALLQLCNGKKDNVIESDALFDDFDKTLDRLLYKVSRGKCGRDWGASGGGISGAGSETGTGTSGSGSGTSGSSVGSETSNVDTGVGTEGDGTASGGGTGGDSDEGKGISIPTGPGKWSSQSELTVVEEVEITCGAEGIQVQATARSAFTGNVYVKGFFHDSRCKKNYADHTGRNVFIDVPVDSCGVRRERDQRGIFVSFVVVFMSHRFVLTKLDKAFRVQCFYMQTDKTVSQSLDVSMIPTVDTLTSVSMPTCTYTLREGSHEGPEVEYATIGMRVFHRWECRGPQAIDYMFGMMVHSCYAHDSNQEKILILDESGCSVDKFVMSNLEYESDLITAYVSTNVFKFADVSDIYFQCQVKICVKPMCEGVTPPNCQNGGRGRRSIWRTVDEGVDEFNVTSQCIGVLENYPLLSEPQELTPYNGATILPAPKPTDDFCLSPITMSAVSGVILSLLLFSLTLAFVLHRRSALLRK